MPTLLWKGKMSFLLKLMTNMGRSPPKKRVPIIHHIALIGYHSY